MSVHKLFLHDKTFSIPNLTYKVTYWSLVKFYLKGSFPHLSMIGMLQVGDHENIPKLYQVPWLPLPPQKKKKSPKKNIIKPLNATIQLTIKTQHQLHHLQQGCKFSCFHKVQIPALLFLFSQFWRLLAQIHALFQAFSFRPAYIPVTI